MPERHAPRGPETLALRLRRETAELHHRVEAATGLPGSIHSRSDYVSLLRRLSRFCRAVEQVWSEPRFADGWSAIGIELTHHRRSHLLRADLLTMGAEPAEHTPPRLDITDFAGALGSLYVAEGSSLGGRVIGPAIRSVVGDVPITFFDGSERQHPAPWRSLKDALGRFDGDETAVVDGARATFRAFEQIVAVDAVALHFSEQIEGMRR